MIIDIEVKDGIKILHPHGQLGGEEGLTLIEEINENLDEVGDCAIVDLADVQTINSAGDWSRGSNPGPGQHARTVRRLRQSGPLCRRRIRDQ